MKFIKFIIATSLLFYSNNLSAEIDVSNFFSNLIPGEGHTEASIQINEDDEPDLEILAFRDLSADEKSNLFTQFSFHTQEINDEGRYITNLGIGYRALNEDKTTMMGINTFYDYESGTIFMGDTLGLIYPHGNNVQPNLPPPDFNKEILFETLEKIYSLELRQLAIAHFGIHSDPYSLIEDAYKSVEEWISIGNSVNEKSNNEASILLKNWVKNNYASLGVEESVIEHYLDSTNFEMQVSGIRNYLNLNNNS